MELVASAGEYACHKEGLLGRKTSWQYIFNSNENGYDTQYNDVSSHVACHVQNILVI